MKWVSQQHLIDQAVSHPARGAWIEIWAQCMICC